MFVVLDNLSIVTSHKWHTDKKWNHNCLFIGSESDCRNFVAAECEKQLAEV